MRILYTVFTLLFFSSVYSQIPKGIVSDHKMLSSKPLPNKNVKGESPYLNQNMNSNTTRANSNGELSMFNKRKREENKLDRFSKSLPKVTQYHILKEINRRSEAVKNFQNINNRRVKAVDSIYNQIPIENFNKVVNGSFRAHLFIKKKYSFSNDQELITEIPCIVMVEESKIVQIYPYGKKSFALDYPKSQASNSYLSSGIVQYNNSKTEETITIVLLDPFLQDQPKQYKVNKDGAGLIKLYTTKKKDDGKLVWIQEIDMNGNINREIAQQLTYAKNQIEASKMDIKPIAINTGFNLYYFGNPTETIYGSLPLFLKTVETDTKPIKNNEVKLVRIMIYRD